MKAGATVGGCTTAGIATTAGAGGTGCSTAGKVIPAPETVGGGGTLFMACAVCVGCTVGGGSIASMILVKMLDVPAPVDLTG